MEFYSIYFYTSNNYTVLYYIDHTTLISIYFNNTWGKLLAKRQHILTGQPGTTADHVPGQAYFLWR